MSAQSLRPIAHRAFSVLVALLLVGSLAAPATIGSAAASTTTVQDDGAIDGSFEGTCDSTLRFAFPISCPFGPEEAYDSVDENQSASLIKTDIHVAGQSTYDRQDSVHTVYGNYLEDTETLASLEARDAIATAYENNKSVTAAQAEASTAIQTYYATHQKNLLADMNSATAQMNYHLNVTRQHDEIDNDFIHPWAQTDVSGNSYAKDPRGLTVNVGLSEKNVTLTNGSTERLKTIPVNSKVYFEGSSFEGTGSASGTIDPITDYDAANDRFVVGSWTYSGNGDTYGDAKFHWNGGMQLMSHADAGLESETMIDYRLYADLWTRLEEQAGSVESSYPQELAQDMYDSMDAGELDPNDVRGAEGMVRYMSGNQTDGEALDLALRHALDLDHPESMDSQMVVNFEGKTDRQRVSDSSDGTVQYNYSTVNETYEGLLFASGVPNGTLEMGVTYNVSADFNGTPSMLTADGEQRFYSGNLTVTEMYDGDGNAVETMNYGGPEYGTYDSEAFIQALQDAAEERAEITGKDEDESGGGGIDFGDAAKNLAEGAAMLGVGLVAIALLAVAGFVLDLIPGLGN